MQRVAVAVLVVVVGLVALASVGCVDEKKYNAVLLRNREQEKLLQEKDAQLATLNERVTALTARAGDANRIITEKEDLISSLKQERDATRRAFDELTKAYKDLATMPKPFSGTGIPDKVAIEIQALAQQYPDVFDFDAATGRLRFKADLTFDSGSDAVKPDAKAALTKLGGILISDAAKSLRINIVGHTDNDPVKKAGTVARLKELGKAPTNQGLSEARAEAVAAALKDARVEAARIATKGVGEAQPMAPNTSAEGKAKNRRVEIFLSQ
jgi:outer membrane protein OmpA-like peptidoglycan-associated protein